jgi:predicted RNA binding protein YcfA (HicA-like mRNA interferase family)
MAAKLPVVKAKDLIKFLCNRRGFSVERISGSHYQLYNPRTGQRATIPYHRTDIRRGTLKEIMGAVGLSREELAEV